MLCEFALRDVGDEADMRPGCLDGATTIERTQVATIPGAAEQGRKRAFGAPQVVENGGELFGEREQAAVGGRLLIAQAMEKGRRREASGGDTFGDPGAIDFREEAADLVQLVPLRALLDSPTSTTKRLRPWRVASTRQWGPGPAALPKATRSWRRMAAGWASVCGARARAANPATP